MRYTITRGKRKRKESERLLCPPCFTQLSHQQKTYKCVIFNNTSNFMQRFSSVFVRLKTPNLFPYHNRILYLNVDTYLIIVPFETITVVVPGNQLIIKKIVEQEYKEDGLYYGWSYLFVWCKRSQILQC